MKDRSKKKQFRHRKALLLFVALPFGLPQPELFATAARPFPQSGNTPCFGIKPNNRSQANMNAAVITCYTSWVANYMTESTTVPGDYKINYDSTGATVSEAMGYGMLATVLMAGADTNAQTYFDGLNRFRKRYPSSIDSSLMEWKIFPDEISRNDDCASDGDLDMAMALLMAYRQWGETNYLQEATTLIQAIETSLIRSDYSIRLGDWNSSDDETRSSDFTTTHFQSFHLATGNGVWTNVENQCYAILEQIQNDYAPATGLLPDFAILSANAWHPAPANFLEGNHDGHYYYNACRDPWRIASSALYYNRQEARSIMEPLMNWVTNTFSEPTDIRAGFTLSGSNISGNDYDTTAFIAPLGISAMVVTNQTWLNQTFTYCIAQHEEYFEDSITLLALITMSGNLWMWDTPDSDQDEIPDAWERKYVQNLTSLSGGESDWDHDGETDPFEYITKTDPTDSNNTFRIISGSSPGGTNRIAWMTAADTTDLSPFSVTYSTNLLAQDGGWMPASGIIELGEPGTIRFIDSKSYSTPSATFYRIIATENSD